MVMERVLVMMVIKVPTVMTVVVVVVVVVVVLIMMMMMMMMMVLRRRGMWVLTLATSYIHPIGSDKKEYDYGTYSKMNPALTPVTHVFIHIPPFQTLSVNRFTGPGLPNAVEIFTRFICDVYASLPHRFEPIQSFWNSNNLEIFITKHNGGSGI